MSSADLGIKVEARETRVDRPKRVKHEAELKTEQKNQEIFSEILNRCKRLVSTAMDYGGKDIFELLDPLISDTQCHLHSVLILDLVHECYNINESTYHGIDKLNERDQEILSYAVLFSLLKVDHKDELGFTLHQLSVNHFSGSILSSKKRERCELFKAKKKFNSYSVEYIKSVASGHVKEILNECTVISSTTKLQLLPSYASMSAVIDYMQGKKLPIIISVVSVNVYVAGGAIKYNMTSNAVGFYEFRESENKFRYKTELSDREKRMPTITFNCYSSTRNSTQEFEMDHNVRDLLLSTLAGDAELSRNTELPAGYEDGSEYARNMYSNHADFFVQYNKHYELAKSRNLLDATYSTAVQFSGDQEDHSCITTKRRREDTFLLVEHVYCSNYSREYERLKSLDFSCELDQVSVTEVNKRKKTMDVAKRLSV